MLPPAVLSALSAAEPSALPGVGGREVQAGEFLSRAFPPGEARADTGFDGVDGVRDWYTGTDQPARPRLIASAHGPQLAPEVFHLLGLLEDGVEFQDHGCPR